MEGGGEGHGSPQLAQADSAADELQAHAAGPLTGQKRSRFPSQPAHSSNIIVEEDRGATMRGKALQGQDASTRDPQGSAYPGRQAGGPAGEQGLN